MRRQLRVILSVLVIFCTVAALPRPATAAGQEAEPPLATAVDQIQVRGSFKVELLYSVPKEQQGSWVSMTPDPKGRLIVSDQDGPLYRVTPGASMATTKVQRLDVPIGEAHGMLWAYDRLYVMVNGQTAEGSGFYRLRDTNGDDQFDEVKLLKRIGGRGEHGPHAIRQGPDGMLYVIAGNHTKIPSGLALDSPHRNWAEDLLLPRNPDGGGHATGVMAPGGWIARTDPDGKKWELICGGFRNAYDMDFNQDGELFAFDADMEWDTGAPWYRPTRVNHAVSAAEFGWRFGTGKWPEYFPDSLASVIDIGMGSPTGVTFGTGAKFPARYQRAYFINDWTFGKIYAVHMTPEGAGYTGTFELFLEGTPLPVTDVVINHDGALYFTTGGRKTQSGLYRVSYVGDEPIEAVGAIEDAKAAQARALRHKLEALHRRQSAGAVEFSWPHLNSTDRNIRYAARVAVERQDLSQWRDRALTESRTTARIQALLGLTRVGDERLQGQVLQRLDEMPLARLSEQQLLEALRVYSLAFIRLGGKSDERAATAAAKLKPLYPAESDLINRELCRLLVYLESPGVVERSMELLKAGHTQQEQMYYTFLLRNVREGWTMDQRRAYFSWLNLAEGKYHGGHSFTRFLARIRQDAVEKLSEKEQAALKDVIAGRDQIEVVQIETSRQFIHNWQLDDLLPLLGKLNTDRSFERGKIAYEAAQCHKCHRLAGGGGATGPDLTAAGNRFSPRDLLDSLVFPSKVISDQYINSVITTEQGELITGRIIEENDERLLVRTHPYARQLTEVRKDHIEDRQPSKVSEMPLGLINVLTQDEVLDMIAYLRSAANPNDKVFRKAQ